MSLRQFWIVAAAALTLVSGCGSSAVGCPAGLDDALRAWGDAGFTGVVTIVHAESQCSRGVGLRDRESSQPMTPDTVFAIGSVSKSVTAAGILHLVADGQLTLTTRADDVVPDLAGPVADVTIEQLMSHTSGILGDAGPDHQPRSRDEAIAAISALPQDFEPGSDFGYTNAGFTLLALVIDTITGNYRDFIIDQILPISGEPTAAGFWDGQPAAQGPRAVRYLDAGRSDVLGQFQGPHWSTSGNGDLAMTVPYLATWSLNLFDGGLLPGPETAELETPRWNHGDGFSETLGWVRYDESVFGAEGFASAGGGGDTGHSAIIAVLPDRETTIAIASNGPDINAEQLMQQLVPALIAGDPLPLPADTSTGDADPAAIAAAVGTYTFADGSEIAVIDDGGHLTVAAIGPTAIGRCRRSHRSTVRNLRSRIRRRVRQLRPNRAGSRRHAAVRGRIGHNRRRIDDDDRQQGLVGERAVRILLVEDDHELAAILATGLRAESYAVDVATTADEAARLLHESVFDVACIDLGFPDGDGLTLIRQLSDVGTRRRRQPST